MWPLESSQKPRVAFRTFADASSCVKFFPRTLFGVPKAFKKLFVMQKAFKMRIAALQSFERHRKCFKNVSNASQSAGVILKCFWRNRSPLEGSQKPLAPNSCSQAPKSLLKHSWGGWGPGETFSSAAYPLRHVLWCRKSVEAHLDSFKSTVNYKSLPRRFWWTSGLQMNSQKSFVLPRAFKTPHSCLLTPNLSHQLLFQQKSASLATQNNQEADFHYNAVFKGRLLSNGCTDLVKWAPFDPGYSMDSSTALSNAPRALQCQKSLK